MRYDLCRNRMIGDIVRIIDEVYSNEDGGMLVRLKIGTTGRVVIAPDIFNTMIAEFDGKSYWVDPKIIERVELLDVLAGLG